MGCLLSTKSTHDDLGPLPNQTTPAVVALEPSFDKQKPKRNGKVNQQPKKKTIHSGRRTPADTTPFYDKLPPRAKKCKVKSVYDGDTITLYNKRRVRFLGMDTPELKNPTQAFSQEAKQYTTQRCLEKQIWISFEGREEQVDRYGRLLAWIWVSTGKGNYECVNEGLLKEGLATVYTPSNGKKLHNMDKLLALQTEARTAKRGLWQNFRDYEVLKTTNGTAFHHKNAKCEHLKRSKKLITVRASVALDEGRHGCRTCLADDQECGSVAVFMGKRNV